MSYRFDGFVLEREQGLFRNGAEVPLEPKSFALLLYLVEYRDRVISRDELIEHIWDEPVVSEAAVSTQIRAIRRALGDTNVQQKFIRTHPKRGFQFVARIDSSEPSDDTTRKKRGRMGTPSLVVLAVVAVGVAAFLWGPPRQQAAGVEAPRLSIAVLPFDNLSGDPSQEYYADAFTEDLITDLSRIRDAFVIAWRSSFTYKGKSVAVTQVAKELGVRYVLEGSVRREGDEVRINVQLIDGTRNHHIWSHRFVRDVTEVFSGQYQVTGQIASALKAELREADFRRQGPQDSMEAWDYALKGNMELVQPDRDFRVAKDLLEKAIELDPKVASAWSGLAFVHFAGSFGNIRGVSQPNSEDMSLQAAKRAVALDPKNAEGHWMVGVGYARNGLTDLAWAACQEAISLNPNNDCGYVCAGLTKLAMGQPEEAVPFFQHSNRLNPQFRTFTKLKFMGVAFVQSGQYEMAIEAVNKALVKAPNDALAYMILSSALALKGKGVEAEAALEQFLSLRGQTTIADLRAAYTWMGPGFERVLEGLRMSGLS
ncbi:winged helix-turn-helix domain-containing tetratricopeptide repeat protein [Roseovarius nitratireducens]|uniref:winged helix-turn-helix domain-containing tetratricopeptide repeat protein n=1 Tax=Roseovarius nitratireducens TaxID=2044597 RepID=UPI000CE1F1E5|nr:winged helix-turn-helix domain-containing tetratricopeptide repeat protein [Roseovarius nitratireducens]